MKNLFNFDNFIKYKDSKYVARIESFVQSLGASAFSNGAHLLIKQVVMLASLMGVRINKSNVKVIVSFLVFCYKFNKQSNLKQLVLYLKACSVLLQKYLGGDFLKDQSPLKMSVSQAGGIPSMMPILHSVSMSNGDYKIIQLWLTLFNLYSILLVKPNMSLSSMVSPGKTFVLSWKKFISTFFSAFEMYWSDIYKNIDLSWVPFPILKASPTSPSISMEDGTIKKEYSTSYKSMISTFGAWLYNPELMKCLVEWMSIIKCSVDFWDLSVLGDAQMGKSSFGTFSVLYRFFTDISILGKMGFKLEAAGKMSIFAMVDPVTQWIFKPLHSFLFKLLSHIPMDGTFNQMKPLLALLKSNPKSLYSFDLSSATDSLPITLQVDMLSFLMGDSLSILWSKILTQSSYFYSRSDWVNGKLCVGDDTLSVTYSVGQPMGALSSWAMLAMTHHALMQYCGMKCGIFPFRSYAVLGDDVLIANSRVAKYYISLMASMGVGLSLPKSMSSHFGTAVEFAKKTFVKVGGEFSDVSPLSLKGLLMAKTNVSSLVDFIDVNLMGPSDFLKVYGYGYSAVSNYHKPFKDLYGHAKLRDSLFTYFLVKDIQETGSYNQAMGRESLSFVSKVSFRGFQMGGFLVENSEFKYTKLVSLNQLIKKLNKLEDELLEWKGKFMSNPSVETIVDKQPVFCLNPFVFSMKEKFELINKLSEDVYMLMDKLDEVEGDDYIQSVIKMMTEMKSIVVRPGVSKDPLLKSEWSALMKFFHSSMGWKKPR